jgi:hypothetical protein
MFVNWTILSGHTNAQLGIVTSALEKPTLTFTFREGLLLRANFITNPYPSLAAAAGTEYLGLIHADAGSPLPIGGTPMSNSTEGLLSVTLMKTGAFTGRMTLDGTVLTMSGAFDATGVARFGTARSTTVTVARVNKPSLVASVNIDLNPARTKDTISATVTATDFQRSVTTGVSKVEANRAYYDGLTVPTTVDSAYLGAANATQAYTVVLPAVDNTALGLAFSDYPQGTGYAFVTVSKAGLVTITSGKLADGTAITGSTKLSKENKCPLFMPLYTNKGWLSGDVELNSTLPDSDMSSTLLWMRPPDTTKQHYPYGWTEVIDVGMLGARYAATFPAPGGSVVLKPDGIDPGDIGDLLMAPDLENGNVSLTLSEGQLADPIEKPVNVSATNVVSKVITNDASYSLTLTAGTGVFIGKFVHEFDSGVVTPLMTDFQGVLYQKGVNSGGHGFFLTRQPTPIDYTGESGLVKLIGN